MIRPCFLMIDTEHFGSISTRKLVIETAKFNVITAYSGAEAIETLQRYPALDGAILDAGIKDIACAEVVRSLKAINATLAVIAIGRPGAESCEGVDHFLYSYQPEDLLELLRTLKPQANSAIIARDASLANE